MLEHLSDWLTYGGLFVFVIGMAWNDGVDRATNYIITATNWNDLIGASGSLMQLKAHAHGGTTGEGSQSLGPLVKATFTGLVLDLLATGHRKRLTDALECTLSRLDAMRKPAP